MDLYYVEMSASAAAPDHERRVELPPRRRDLLRHGHLARRARARDGLHAECEGGEKAAEGGKANIFDIQPQMWTYERPRTKPYRAFVTIPGHLYSTFELPQYRAILLRGIAWAAHRENLDEFCKKEELDKLTYPPGGPSRPADELAQLEVHPDFKMTLVASEPLITKPICLDWDPAGRLWVAESPEYPNGSAACGPDYRRQGMEGSRRPRSRARASSSARGSTRSASSPRAKATA